MANIAVPAVINADAGSIPDFTFNPIPRPPILDDSNIIYFPPPASAEEPPEPFVAPRGTKPPLDEDFIHARLQDLTERYREIPENPSPWPMVLVCLAAWLIAGAALAFVLIG